MIRVDDFLNWRVPAEPYVALDDLQHRHSSSRDDGNFDPAVVDHDDVDPFLPTAVQRDLMDRPWDVRSDVGVAALELPLVDVYVVADAGEDFSIGLGMIRLRTGRHGEQQHSQHRDA